MASEETRQRILDAAERILGERGFVGTSLRAVTSAAGVNLAAVHYHFGSKEALLEEVFHRRVAPINQERLKRLDRLEARTRGGPPTVEELLEAMLRPGFQVMPGAAWVRRFAGRIYGEPKELVAPLIQKEFAEVSRRFTAALGRVLPDVPADVLEWRHQFVIGVLIYVLTDSHLIHPGDTPAEATDPEALMRRMIEFSAAGLRAPVAEDDA